MHRLTGGNIYKMSVSKRLVVSLSETLCREFDEALKEDSKKRSEFIREAIILYIEKKKNLHLIEEMKKGYVAMSKINSQISEMGIGSDFKSLKDYEDRLSESDLSDDNDSKKRRYLLC